MSQLDINCFDNFANLSEKDLIRAHIKVMKFKYSEKVIKLIYEFYCLLNRTIFDLITLINLKLSNLIRITIVMHFRVVKFAKNTFIGFIFMVL